MKMIFTDHALRRMAKRQLKQTLVENVVNSPLRIEADKNDPDLEHRLGIVPEVAERAFRRVLRHDAPSLASNNRAFLRVLRDGVPIEYRREDGTIAGDHVRLIDFDSPDANDWLAVNQFTVIEGQNNRQPDIGL
jgi:type I site-specific restriction-modification system R (restriction) subunit